MRQALIVSLNLWNVELHHAVVVASMLILACFVPSESSMCVKRDENDSIPYKRVCLFGKYIHPTRGIEIADIWNSFWLLLDMTIMYIPSRFAHFRIGRLKMDLHPLNDTVMVKILAK